MAKNDRAALGPAMQQGLTAACVFMVGQVKKSIKGGRDYEPNALLTVAMKGSMTPLIDSDSLVNSVSYRILNKAHAVVGASLFRSGKNVGIAIHDGFSIDLSQPRYRKMRAFLVHKAKETGIAGRGSRLGKKTGFLVVPPRPFIGKPFSNKANVKQIEALIANFVERAVANDKRVTVKFSSKHK